MQTIGIKLRWTYSTGSGEGKIRRSAEKLWCSMPNIHLELDATNTNESKCIPVMQVLANAENGSIKMTLDDPIIDLGTVADDELTATSVEKGPRAAARCGNEQKNRPPLFLLCM
ncbi:unnamed protein product, partial [Aphis gossypii]